MDKRPGYIVPPEKNGSRLDAFVSGVLGCGVRTGKRMAEAGRVLVNGTPKPAHFKLSPGMAVTLRETAGPEPAASGIALAAATDEYAVFFKPAGLHSAKIAGNAEPSLEEILAREWNSMRFSLRDASFPVPVYAFDYEYLPDILAQALGGAPFVPNSPVLPLAATVPVLLSRLDKPTSGLVSAAFTDEAARRFRDFEIRGTVEKYYLAVVLGEMDSPLTVRNALDTDNRKKTRALPEETPDETRHTFVTPVGPARSYVPEAPKGCTLVTARIKRGARHQIRAHLAASGYPLAGDDLYGGGTGFSFHLHHARLRVPGIDAFFLPPWLHLP